MKQRIVIALLVSLSLLLLGSACKKNPALKAPDAAVPEGFDEAGSGTAFGEVMSEVSILSSYEDRNFVRKVTDAEAFIRLLKSDEKDAVRLELKGENSVLIPNLNLSDKTLIFDSAETGVAAEGPLGTVIVNSLGSEGLTVRSGVDSLAVYGEGVNVNIDGGAGLLYVQGENCTLKLNSGIFGEIYSVNQTVVIENHTDRVVTVRMANGAVQLLGTGETLSFSTEPTE